MDGNRAVCKEVLGGRGMEVVYDPENLKIYMEAAEGVTPDRPILIDRFLRHAMECEADAISDGEHAFDVGGAVLKQLNANSIVIYPPYLRSW